MIRMLIAVALLFGPTATFTPAPAAAQMQGSLGCTTNSGYSSRWNTRRYEYTAYGQEVQNACDYAIRYYYCFSTDPNPESCASVSQFGFVTLAPRERRRLGVNRSNSVEYLHNIQCLANEPLIDWRSKFTSAKGPRCSTPLPPGVDRSLYQGQGIAPDPRAPAATPRGLSSLLNVLEFPPRLLGTLAEGRTIAHIAVSPEGRAVGCRIASSAGFTLMDKATCDVFMRRGRFQPAVDASGLPVPGFYEAKIVWTSP